MLSPELLLFLEEYSDGRRGTGGCNGGVTGDGVRLSGDMDCVRDDTVWEIVRQRRRHHHIQTA